VGQGVASVVGAGGAEQAASSRPKTRIKAPMTRYLNFIHFSSENIGITGFVNCDVAVILKHELM
jgi:hypothetical protein